MEFMAIETHTYRHDLESLFYVLLWPALRPSWLETSGQLQGAADAKPIDKVVHWQLSRDRECQTGHMHVELEELPQTNFDSVKPLCRELRRMLFPCRVRLFTGTPKDPEIIYGPITKCV
jgi:hypothetical protein